MPELDPIPELKRQLAAELATLLEGWNLDDAGASIHADRWRVAEIRAGRLDRFSLETLIRFVTRLRHHVELHVVKDPPKNWPRAGHRVACSRARRFSKGTAADIEQASAFKC